MTRVIVDAELRKKLHDLSTPLDLCDESGKLLGRVFPTVDLSDFEKSEPPLDRDELERLRSSTEWYTTAEVLAHLKSLEGN